MAGNDVSHPTTNDVDVIFELDNGEQVVCQRSVMARASPFLKTMFAYDDKPIYKMKTKEFELIHRWAFQSQLPNKIDMEIIVIADYFLAEELLERCIEKYWDSATSRSDLTKLMNFVTSTESLVATCVTSYMAKNFDQALLWMAELVQLPHTLLIKVFQSASFTVTSEAFMMEVLQGWAYKDYVRQRQLPEIIQQVQAPDEVTIAWQNGTGYIYTRNTNTWHEVPALDLMRSRFAVTRIGSILYVAGGCSGNYTSLDTVLAMDMENPQAGWQKCSSMKIARQNFALVSLGGSLYALGGIGIGTVDALNSCEVYDPTSNEWREIASMSQGRSKMGVAISNSLIIVVGGKCSIYNYLSSTELFDPTTNTWIQLPSMKTKRLEPCCTVFQGKLLAMGGGFYSVERLDLDNADNGWSDDWPDWPDWSSMEIPEGISSAYSVNDNIFVIRRNGRLDSFDGQNWHQGKNPEGWPLRSEHDVTTTTVKMTGQLRTLIAEARERTYEDM